MPITDSLQESASGIETENCQKLHGDTEDKYMICFFFKIILQKTKGAGYFTPGQSVFLN